MAQPDRQSAEIPILRDNDPCAFVRMPKDLGVVTAIEALFPDGSDPLPLTAKGIHNQGLNVLVCQQRIAESLHAEIWKSQTTSFFIDSAAY